MNRRAYVPLPRRAKSPARGSIQKILRSEARAGSVNPGAGSRRSLGLRLEVPARRSPVYTITMGPIIPTHQMLSIAPNLLITQRLILRPWRESDRDEFARLNRDPVVMEFMPRRLSRDESDAVARRIQASIEQRGWGFWAVEVKGGDARVRTGEAVWARRVPLNKRSIGVMERIGMSRDPADDFDHPKLSAGHPLRRHVLYRIDRNEWLNRHGSIDRM
jgi:RimJ/RimL family protein N-acetyltransferase